MIYLQVYILKLFNFLNLVIKKKRAFYIWIVVHLFKLEMTVERRWERFKKGSGALWGFAFARSVQVYGASFSEFWSQYVCKQLEFNCKEGGWVHSWSLLRSAEEFLLR